MFYHSKYATTINVEFLKITVWLDEGYMILVLKK